MRKFVELVLKQLLIHLEESILMPEDSVYIKLNLPQDSVICVVTNNEIWVFTQDIRFIIERDYNEISRKIVDNVIKLVKEKGSIKDSALSSALRLVYSKKN